MWTEPGRGNRGSALLAVLWLVAALSAISFAIASTVRAETERSSNALEGLRAYYVAVGAIERAILYMDWGPGPQAPDGTPRYWAPWRSWLYFQFPAGEAVVHIIPESSKLNLNSATQEELYALLLALGAEPERAQEIAQAIVDWRSPAPGGLSPFDQYYLGLAPSFRARHASFEEVEEALLVKGMTPELFYGGYESDGQGRLRPRAGFRDCVTVYGTGGRVDVNSAPAPLLASLGLSPAAVQWIEDKRRRGPFRDMRELEPLAGERGFERLGIGGGTILTLHATARPRLPGGALSDLRRSVAATIKRLPPGWDRTYHVLRWYENAWGYESLFEYWPSTT